MDSSLRVHFETVTNCLYITRFGRLASKNSVRRGTTVKPILRWLTLCLTSPGKTLRFFCRAKIHNFKFSGRNLTTTPEKTSSHVAFIVVGSVCGIFMVAIIVACLCFCRKRRRDANASISMLPIRYSCLPSNFNLEDEDEETLFDKTKWTIWKLITNSLLQHHQWAVGSLPMLLGMCYVVKCINKSFLSVHNRN